MNKEHRVQIEAIQSKLEEIQVQIEAIQNQIGVGGMDALGDAIDELSIVMNSLDAAMEEE